MKRNLVCDGQDLRSRRHRMPQAIGLAFINLIAASGAIAGVVGAIGFTGLATLALGVGYAVTIGGAYLLSRALMKQQKPATQQPSDVQSNIRQEISARRRIYGRFLTGSVIIFGFRRGEKSYLLHYICEGPIKGYVSFRMDKKPITLDANGFVTDAQYQVGGRSRVQILTTLGTMTDEPFAALLAAFPELDTPLTPFRHRGCAMALQIVEQVPQEQLTDVYPNNMPTLQFLVDGWDEVYDPRVGTKGFTDSAGCCLLTEIMDVYGLTEESVEDVDFASFAAFSDHCDEAVAKKGGGTEPRYRCAGQISMDAENENRVKAIADICNADVYMDRQGRIAVRQKLRTSPGIALRAKNGDHLDLQLEGGRSIQKLFNTAKVTYVEPALNYKANEVSWRHPDLFEEDGREYSEPITALLCPSATQAQRIGKLAVFEANPDFAGSITSGPQALDLMDDYVFTLDLSPEDQFERVACAMNSIEYDGAAMTVSAPFVVFREGANEWEPDVDEQDAVVVPPDLPSNVDDVLLDVLVTVETQENSSPVLKFSWDAAGTADLPDSYAQQVQVSAADADDWHDAVVNQQKRTAIYGPVADGGAYDWRIRNIAGGQTFDWQVSPTPVEVTVNPVPPLALTSFAPANAGPYLGGVSLAFTTRNDANLRAVKIYRKPTGVALDLATDSPVSGSLYVGSLSTYAYADGDLTRANLVTNGSFGVDADWTKTNMVIASGLATKTVTGVFGEIKQTKALTNLKNYRWSAIGSSISGGTIVARLFGSTSVSSASLSNGSNRGSLVANAGSNAIGFATSLNMVGSVDDFVLFEETPSCVPQGVWDYYAVPFNASGIDGPVSGPVTVTII